MSLGIEGLVGLVEDLSAQLVALPVIPEGLVEGALFVQHPAQRETEQAALQRGTAPVRQAGLDPLEFVRAEAIPSLAGELAQAVASQGMVGLEPQGLAILGHRLV